VHYVKRPHLEAVSERLQSEDDLAEGEDLAACLAAELLIDEQRLSKRLHE
jgi:hypothetical protein